MKTYRMKITEIDCANCAAKLEDKLNKIEGVEEVIINFMAEKLIFKCEEEQHELILQQIIQMIEKYEPDAVLAETDGTVCYQNNQKKKHEHHHDEHCECGHEHHHHHDEHCECGHEHHHHHDEHCECGHEHHEMKENIEASGKQQYILENLDCANCAAKIENELKKLPELSNVSLNFMNKTLRYDTNGDLNEIKAKIEKIIAKYEPDVKMVEKVNGKEKETVKKTVDKELVKIFVGGLFFGLAVLCKEIQYVGFGLFMISYLILGLEVLLRAIKNILKGQVFDENFLMALATVGAIAIKEYPEGVMVMLLYQIGEYFQAKAVEKSRKSISSLMDIRPEFVRVLRNGEWVEIDPNQAKTDELMVVLAGERIALDGIVFKGKSSLDTSALTGESKPREIEEGDPVISGSINLDGRLEVKITHTYQDSTVAKILEMVENASSRKAPAEQFITKFARVYTPIVVILACCIAFICPFILPNADFYDYFYRALSFLVVSCPCALVISVPLSYYAGIGGLSKKGILVKGSSYLDALTQAEIFVFDKTGTLTQGHFKTDAILSDDPENCLKIAASLEQHSNHPISKAILEAYQGQALIEFDEVKEVAGRGIEAYKQGVHYFAGNLKLMQENGIEVNACEESGTHIYVAKEDQFLGVVVVKDQIKNDAKKMIQTLHKLNKKCIMLTGDNQKTAYEVAKELQVDEVYYELLPADKVEKVENIMAQGQGKVAFVGDGINDAPVLSIVDIGFAMGALGSDAAIEAADIVLMNDALSDLITTIQGAKKTKAIVYQNIIFSLAVKIGVLIITALGYGAMGLAVFADVGVAFIAILNAIRALKLK